MTLYRQMFIFIFLLCALLFVAASAIKLQSTRGFLEEQLTSHAQDTATSLGLSILPHIGEGDLAMVETMVNAVYDRGYYQRIVLSDLNGKVLLERRQAIVVDAVPAWFVAAIPLAAPEASTLITSGWQRFGNLTVVSHPGYAYQTLWQSSVRITAVFAAIAALTLLAGAWALNLLLKPLKEVEKQAEDLCRRQYRLQTSLPRTRELRRVVVAMNTMTDKVRLMFSEQAQLADNFRRGAYSDPLTGVGNRRYLEGQVAAAMEGEAGTVHGALLLVAAHDLIERNRRLGYAASDRFLQAMAKQLGEAIAHLPRAALARISGGTFAILLPEITGEEASHLAGECMRRLARNGSEGLAPPDNLAHLGGVIYDQPTPLGELLAEADRLLAEATTRGANTWAIATHALQATSLPRGEQQWRELLDRLLEKKSIAIFRQKTVAGSDADRVLHSELLARMVMDDGQLLNAGLFIPLAERLQRIAAIDRLVIERGLRLSTEHIAGEALVVNLSTASLKDEGFVAWLLEALRQRQPQAPPMIFEFTEFQATQELTLIEHFATRVRELGHAIGLDHFGQSLVNFGYLKSLQPRHVKIDRAFTDELKNDEGNSRFFIGTLVTVAHSLDILVIAEGVEDQQQLTTLNELNIDGVQGYLLDRPSELPLAPEEQGQR